MKQMLIVFMIGLLARISAGQMVAPADQAADDESQVSGQAQVARWDALLNQIGADAFNKVASPVDSNSKVYKNYKASALELRQCMVDAKANNGVEQFGRRMGYMNGNSITPGQLFFQDYDQSAQGGPGFNEFGDGRGADTFTRTPGDHVKAKISQIFQGAQLMQAQRNIQSRAKASIDFDGELAPGESIAFMAPFTYPNKTIYYHLIVYEVFKCDDSSLQKIQNESNSGWWCKNGPALARKWASASMIWEMGAAHSPEAVDPQFVKKLDDGKEMKLIGLTRPSVAPWCWWDAKGNPIACGENWGVSFDGENPPEGLWAEVEVTGPATEWPRETPTTQPVVNIQNYPQGQTYSQRGFVQVQQDNLIQAHTPVGDWQEVAQMRAGESKDIDGSKVKITDEGSGRQYFSELIEITNPADDRIGISAVRADGMEAGSYSNNAAIVFGETGITQFNTYQNFQGMEKREVSYFRVSKRKMQTVKFEGFATNPMTAVKTDITAEDMSAATRASAERAQKAAAAQAAEQVKQFRDTMAKWNAVKPDATDPMGMLRLVTDAANAGDVKTVRSYLHTADPANNDHLDVIAKYIVGSSTNWKRGSDKFGDEKMLAASRAAPGIMPPPGQEFETMDWKKADDGSMTANELALRKDTGGKYYLDLDEGFKQASFFDALTSIIAAQERVAKALDQKDVTIEQIQAAGVPQQ